MARFPKLVPKRLCKVPIEVHIDGEQNGLNINEDGEPIHLDEADLFCNYQDGGQTTVNSDHEYVRVSGSAYFNGDPFPDVSNITGGYVIIFGQERKIEQGIKSRNPDGTVNFTQLRLL